jgi:O-antigen/teichoic acid export membrane protein
VPQSGRYNGAHRSKPARQRKQSAGRRLSVIAIDQAIAGASNVLIALLAVRVLTTPQFGLFGVVFLVYVIAQGVSRALVNDPLLVHPLEAAERAGDAIGTTCLVSFGMACLVAAAGIVAVPLLASLGYALLVLAACLPLLALQDLGRYLGFVLQRPSNAVVLDTTWLVLLFGGVAALLALNARTLAWFIVAWGGTGAVTGLLTLRQHLGRKVRFNLSWLRNTWSFSWRYLISYTSTQGAALIGSSAVGGIAGTRALGAVQGTVLLARPFGTFQIAAVAAAVAEISRSARTGYQVRQYARKNAALTTTVAVINGAIMLTLPDKIGTAIFHDTWHAAHPLLLATAAQIFFLGLITGPRSGLLGMRAVRIAVVIDVVNTVLMLIGTVVGALEHGVLGAIWGVALAEALIAVVWWTVLTSHTNSNDLAAEVDDDAGDVATAAALPMMPPSA